METNSKSLKILYWLPRILGILFILFLALFALDVFEIGRTPNEIAGGLFMHLIPNFILAGVLYLAWKKEKAGGFIFILLGLGFTIFFNTYTHVMNFLLTSFPVLLIGVLFLLHDYLLKRR